MIPRVPEPRSISIPLRAHFLGCARMGHVHCINTYAISLILDSIKGQHAAVDFSPERSSTFNESPPSLHSPFSIDAIPDYLVKMLRSSILVAFLGAVSVFAAPSLVKRQSISDTQILQFALTLEHLENAFYSAGLAQFDAQTFEDAGFPFWVRGRFEEIAAHEAIHVATLTKALGSDATQACNYSFPYHDVQGWVSISMALETVGSSAYMGATSLISNKDTLTTAASILTVEARQAGWIASAVLKGSAWDGAFETPLGLNGVFSLASAFIVSCPASDPTLPVTTLPALTATPTSGTAAALTGSTLSLSFTLPASESSSSLFLAYFNGLTVLFSPIESSGGEFTTTVPQGLFGTTYAAVVQSNENATDSSLLTGLAMLELSFLSFQSD